MIRIYHINMGRSLRILWLMEEFGEPYELETVTLPANETFRAASPMATVPSIVDGDIVMGESIAILQYLTGRRLQKSMELGLTVGPNPAGAIESLHPEFVSAGVVFYGGIVLV
jgi:glutathione S-transferase